MAYSTTLSAVAAVSLAGAALGVHFGHAAIGAIKPFYFEPEPASHFYADAVPAGYHPAEINVVPASDFWVNDVNASGRGECGGCGNRIDEIFAGAAPPSDMEGPPEAVPAVAYDTVADDPPPPSQIERYSSFPVTLEEAHARSQMAQADREADTPMQRAATEGPVGM